MRIAHVLALVAISCAPCPSCPPSVGDAGAAAVAPEEALPTGHSDLSRSRTGVRCDRLLLDPEADYFDAGDAGEGFGEWLEEACYQQHRFLLEYAWCMYGHSEQFPMPDRRWPHYPCRFSDRYLAAHPEDRARAPKVEEQDGFGDAR